jgi:hypothetical protein
MMKYVKTTPRMIVPAPDLDRNPYLLGVNNGAIILCNDKLLEVEMTELITLSCRLNYDRSALATLTSWLEAIVGMWRFSKSNVITEGFHTKMEIMSQRAFGFRNFENYRLRVLTHCGWDGIINRV